MTGRVRNVGLYLLMMIPALICAGCGVTHLNSSNTPISSPTGNTSKVASGPLWDAWWEMGSGGIRVVYGVPGAAHQGTVAYNDGSYSGAAACMRAGIALLTTQAGSLFEIQLPQGAPTLLNVPGIRNPSIIFSPSCSTALEYSLSGAQVIQGFPLSTNAHGFAVPDNSSLLAVSDTGSVLVGTSRTDGSLTVGLLTLQGAEVKPLTVLAKLGGALFLPGSDTVLLADSAANTITQVSSSLGVVRVAGQSDGVNNPVAVGISADGHTAVVANSSGSGILRIDLTRLLPPAETVCRCSPTELVPQAGNLSFRLNEPGTGTVWAFDGDAVTPRTIFVPSEQPAVNTKGARR